MRPPPAAELRDEARAAAARGDWQRAREVLYAAVAQTIAREEEYVAAVADLRDVLVRLGDHRGALTADWYAGNERTQKPLLAEVPPIDRARTLLAWADRAAAQPERAKALYMRAADEYEQAAWWPRQHRRERGVDFVVRARCGRACRRSSAPRRRLQRRLARFNLARMSRKTGDKAAHREASVAAVHLLEEAADRYETIGQRERAFDCYQVLIAIGRESGEFEHVLEGYVNVIRILREDHLRYYALQSYEEAVAAAEKQGEVSAAATLAREMAAYARKEGLAAVANSACWRGAPLAGVASMSRKRGAPP